MSLSPFHVFKLSECIIKDVVRDNIKEEKALSLRKKKALSLKILSYTLHYIHIDIFLPNCKKIQLMN